MRLFVALYPPSEIVSQMSALLSRVELPKHRPTPPEQVHLTAMFIGDRDERALDDVIETLAAACRGVEPFRLRPVLLTVLPERGPKRTVVVECDRPGGMLELHARLVRRFASEPKAHRVERFVPHVTIARFPGAGSRCALREPVQIGDFEVRDVRLMSSELRPSGAVHRECVCVGLSSA